MRSIHLPCKASGGILTLLLASVLLSSSLATARQLRRDYQGELRLIHASQNTSFAGQNSTERAFIQNYRLGSIWKGPGFGSLHDGQLFVNSSLGDNVSAHEIELLESLNLKHSRLNLQLNITGLARISDGDLNLNLSEQVDRNRTIGILENLNPGSTANSGNRLYEERLAANGQATYQISRRMQLNADISQQLENRRNRFSEASLLQKNSFHSYNLGFSYRLLPRSFLQAHSTLSHFGSLGEIRLDEQNAPQSIEIKQEDRSWEAGIGHRLSRLVEVGASYFRLNSTADGLEPSEVQGPGLYLNWQINRLNTINIQVRRLTLKQADDEIVGEFGTFQYQRLLSAESELVLQIEKTYDNARASFEALSNNQLQLDARRNRILQAFLQSSKNWRRLRWTNSWSYLEYETPLANPSFQEHRLTSELQWQANLSNSAVAGSEIRQSSSNSPDSEENLKIYAGYFSYQRKFFPDFQRKVEGYMDAGLRYDWSNEAVQEIKIRRLAATISGGLIL